MWYSHELNLPHRPAHLCHDSHTKQRGAHRDRQQSFGSYKDQHNTDLCQGGGAKDQRRPNGAIQQNGQEGKQQEESATKSIANEITTIH